MYDPSWGSVPGGRERVHRVTGGQGSGSWARIIGLGQVGGFDSLPVRLDGLARSDPERALRLQQGATRLYSRMASYANDTCRGCAKRGLSDAYRDVLERENKIDT